VYPGDLLCILVTPDLACQGVGRCSGGFRQACAATPCRQSLVSPTGRDLPAIIGTDPVSGGPSDG
jgi:hypothetical protein